MPLTARAGSAASLEEKIPAGWGDASSSVFECQHQDRALLSSIVRAAVRPPAKIASNKISALRTVGSGGRSSTLTFGVLLREGP